jgi:hypothetical protein
MIPGKGVDLELRPCENCIDISILN